MEKNLIILRGIAGAGKSSFAKLLSNGYPHPLSVICSADDALINQDGEYVWSPERMHMAHQYCKDTATLACACETPLVIIDNTNTTPKEYKFYVELAQEYGYNVRSIIVENTHGNKSIHDVPEETMEKMRNRFVVNL